MKVLVVGDSMLDLNRYVQRSRPSPEAPNCWIVEQDRQEYGLGGAANVARWLAADPNLEVTLLTTFGNDPISNNFLLECKRWNINLSSRLRDPQETVTVKERIIIEDIERNRIQQLLRLDADTKGELTPAQFTNVVSEINRSHYDAIVAIDYGKKMFQAGKGDRLIELIGRLSEKECPVTIANSKYPGRWKSAHIDVMICNQKEMVDSLAAANVRAARSIVKALHVIVTQGAGGVTSIHDGDPIHRLPIATEVLDVTGAGDAFTAGLLRKLLSLNWRPHTLKPIEMVDILDFAQVSAAHCLSQVGCGNPLVAMEYPH
jgi:bifunctional ADP-heptose synthase (sugar kinase/adenylyltransferase)